MTREEAIAEFQNVKDLIRQDGKDWFDERDLEIIDMAIEALTEPKTIIGIDIPYGSDKGIATIFKGNDKMVLEEVKEIMSVVRCKDCINYETCNLRLSHWWKGGYTVDIEFCSFGERREE